LSVTFLEGMLFLGGGALFTRPDKPSLLYSFEDKNDASFSINFESGSVDDYSCKPEILEKVKEVIKPQELYLFISDVLRHF